MYNSLPCSLFLHFSEYSMFGKFYIVWLCDSIANYEEGPNLEVSMILRKMEDTFPQFKKLRFSLGIDSRRPDIRLRPCLVKNLQLVRRQADTKSRRMIRPMSASLRSPMNSKCIIWPFISGKNESRTDSCVAPSTNSTLTCLIGKRWGVHHSALSFNSENNLRVVITPTWLSEF